MTIKQEAIDLAVDPDRAGSTLEDLNPQEQQVAQRLNDNEKELERRVLRRARILAGPSD